MKELLDWQSKEVVNIIDEVTLWSAPFGRLLLDNIPMNRGATIVDIGFGTGFPLIELSQRFGDSSIIYGIDIWKEAIKRVKEKIKVLGLSNIEIIEESATTIDIGDEQVDLVTSNLGINNFEDKTKVYGEIRRILKPDGRLCLTTNPIGTFEELFTLFASTMMEMDLHEESKKLSEYVAHRGTPEKIIKEFKESGFKCDRHISDVTKMRFIDSDALMNHSLIRFGFRASWEDMIREEMSVAFFQKLKSKIDNIVRDEGEFQITIPMLYLEFVKE